MNPFRSRTLFAGRRLTAVIAAAVSAIPVSAYALGGPVPGAVSAQTVKLPSMPGSVRGLADDAAVTSFTGQVQYQIPIEVPTAAGGVAPSLALGYNGDLGNGPLGVGWSFSQPGIRRSLRLGVPAYDATDELELVGMPVSGQLVPLPDGTYRVESQANRYTGRAVAGGFELVDPNGVIYRLGETTAGRKASGSQVAFWYLEQIQYTNGQTIDYRYAQDQGEVYLAGITWGPPLGALKVFRAEMVYESRGDAVVSYRTGFRVATAQRLAKINILSYAQVQRTIALSYDEQFALSRLQQVKVTSGDGLDALPPVTFSYATASTGTVTQVPDVTGWGLNLSGTSLFDVDDDGAMDLLRITPTGHSYRRNLGGSFGASQPVTGAAGASLGSVRMLDLTGDSGAEMVWQQGALWTVFQLTGPDPAHRTWTSLGNWGGVGGITLGSVAVADLDGDYRMDVLSSSGGLVQARFGGASGLAPAVSLPAIDPARTFIAPGNANTLFPDINGDGLADAVYLAGTSMYLYLGTGDGHFAKYRDVAYPWTTTVTTNQIRIGDLDRDGLLDLAMVDAGNVRWYRGKADGTVASTPVTVARPAGTDSTVVVAIADANGNGSEDIVWSSDAGMWILDLAGASSAGMLTAISNGLGQTQSFGYTSSAALAFAAANAGAPWATSMPVSIPVTVSTQRTFASGEPARISQLAVRDGLYDRDERRFIGFETAQRTEPGATTADDVVTLTRFAPGLGDLRALRGQVVFERVLDGLGKVYRETENDVIAATVAGMPNDPRLRRAVVTETRVRHLEGTVTPIVVRTRYLTDPEGRVIERDEDGRTDRTGDETITTYLYASTDPVIGVKDKVCEEAVLSASRVAVSRTRHLFGDSTQVMPLCQTGKGWEREQQGFLASSNRWVSTTRTTYDAKANVLSTDEGGVLRRFGYDPYGQFALSETVTPEAGRDLTWTAEWNTALALVRRVTGPDGVVTTADYDGVGRVRSLANGTAAPHTYYRYAWIGPRPSTETFVYDGEGPTPATLPTTWTATGGWRRSVQVANSAGEALFTATQVDVSRWIVPAFQARDARGRVVTETRPFYATATDPLVIAVPAATAARTVAYDALDRPVLETQANGGKRRFLYSALALTDTADLLAPVRTQLDGFGRTIRTERTVNGIVESLDASYDPAGRVLGYALQGTQAVHSFTYDTLGRMIAASDPDLGARSLQYNDQGQLTRHTNGAGEVVVYTYDGAARLTSVVSNAGPLRLHYDVARTNGYDRTSSRLAWVEEPTGTVDLGYDAFGQQSQFHRNVIDGTTITDAVETRVFSPSGLLRTRSFDDGLALVMRYDAAGRATGINNEWSLDLQDAEGLPLKEHFGNAVGQSYTRLPMGTPNTVHVAKGATVLYDVAMGYNAYGAITLVVDRDGIALDHAATFTYDGGGRLTAATLGSVAATQYKFGFAYDGLQNMIRRDVSGPTSLGVLAGTYTYAAAHPRQLAGVTGAGGTSLATFGYDGAGRQISGEGRSWAYDALSQLTHVGGVAGSAVDYRYGFDGQRVVTHDAAGHASYWLTPDLFEHDNVRDHYLKVGDRVVARITRTRVAPLAMMTGNSSVIGALAGTTPLDLWFLGLVGVAFVMGASIVVRLRRGDRRVGARIIATAAGFGLVGCATAAEGDLSTSAQSATWQTSQTIYFHAGAGAGPVLATDATGAVYEERRYEPFGGAIDELRSGGSIGAVDYRREPINGLNKPSDPDTGASYHGARWMAADSARWLTPDPPVQAPNATFLRSPWTLHPYQYVSQNPIQYWDPDGRDKERAANGNSGPLVVVPLTSGEFSLFSMVSRDRGVENGNIKFVTVSGLFGLSETGPVVKVSATAFSTESHAPGNVAHAKISLFTATGTAGYDPKTGEVGLHGGATVVDGEVGVGPVAGRFHGGLTFGVKLGWSHAVLDVGPVGIEVGHESVDPVEPGIPDLSAGIHEPADPSLDRVRYHASEDPRAPGSLVR